MDEKKPTSSQTDPRPPGPGRLLQQARKDLRLAPEDVAQILHLSSKQIVALEEEDFNSLPGSTYIRGYLRSYAQLLGLSPEKVLEQYNQLSIPIKPLSPPQSAPPPQITSSDRKIKAATAGVTAVILGLVYLWWSSNEEQTEIAGWTQNQIDQSLTAEPVQQNGLTEYPPSLSDSNFDDSQILPPPGPTALPSSPNSAQSAPPPAMELGQADRQVTVSGMILNVSPAESTSPAGPRTVARSDRALARARRAENIPLDIPRSKLVLYATQESWADIRDARDNKLLYENIRAGRSITIEGLAPFSVFLGNADGVRVEFNGKNIDHSRYKRGQVARFTLGENSAVNN